MVVEMSRWISFVKFYKEIGEFQSEKFRPQNDADATTWLLRDYKNVFLQIILLLKITFKNNSR